MMKKLNPFLLLLFVLLFASHANADWLTGWTYRRQIPIALAAGAGMDYQVKIEVHHARAPDVPGVVYVDNNAYSNFKDVRFTGGDGDTLLDYWIEEIATGYVANNGISRPIYNHQKPAYYFNGKTYITWGTLDPVITAYDHAAGTWAAAVVVATNPLANDDHGVPDIAIDSNGYIHVFYGSHNSAQKYARSTNPEDITAWTDKSATLVGQTDALCTYPITVVLSDDTILLYHRGLIGISRDWMVSKTVDGGDTWAGPTQIIDAGGGWQRIYVYDIERETDTKIHLVWSRFESGGYEALDVYHAYHNPATGNLFSQDGTNLGAVISRAEADANCKVWDSGAVWDGGNFISLVGSTPFIVWAHIINDTEAYCYFSKWMGAAWLAPVQITQYDYKYNTAGIIALDANNLEVYLCNNGAAGHGGNIYKWTSADGGTNWTEEAIILSEISDSNTGTVRDLAQPRIVRNGDDDIKLIFCQTENNDWATTLKVYAYGEGGILGTTDAVGAFWIKVDDDLTSNQNIYMYYGNATATSLSSGANTFINFFDAEAANALDEWEMDVGEAMIERATPYGGHTGFWTFAQVDADQSAHYPAVAGAPVAVTARRVLFHFYDWTGNTGQNQTIAQDGVTVAMIMFRAAQSTANYSYRIGAANFTSAIARGIGAWHNFEYLFKTGNVVGKIDGTQVFSVAEPDTLRYINIGSWEAYGHAGYYDDIFIAKYVDPEPTVGTAGPEVQSEAVTIELKAGAIIEAKDGGKITIK